MPPFIIRPFDGHDMETAGSDIAAVTTIYGYHVLHGRASFETVPPPQPEMAQRFTALIAANYPIYVAMDRESGEIIGFAYAGPHKARAAYNQTVEDSVYVAAANHKSGVGTLLLTALLEAATHCGYRQMMAVIGNSEAGSIALHKKLGFTMIGTAQGIGYKFGDYIDVTYMQRALQPVD